MKAVLVIDMPNSCDGCPCCCDCHCSRLGRELGIWTLHTGKPVDCPLKPLPTKITTATLSEREQERTELFTSMALLKTYADGWNDCLKGITDD